MLNHLRRVFCSICAVLAAATLLGACSSSGSSTSGDGSGNASASPVKIMDITTLSSPGQAINIYPESVAAAKAAAASLNKTGGIGGHPVQIVPCDDQGQPNMAAQCGREAVSDGVIAATSSSLLAPSYDPALIAGNVALVGNQPASAPDLTSPISFPTGPSIADTSIGGVLALVKAGYKRIGIASIDASFADATVLPMIKALENAGGTLAVRVPIPLTATDYSGYVQQFKDAGATAVVLELSAAGSIGVVRAAAQIGYKPTYLAFRGAMTSAQAAQIAPLMTSAINVGEFPLTNDSNYPGMKVYLSDMAAEKARGDSAAGNLSDTAFLTWLAVRAIAAVMQGYTGPVDAKTFMTRLRATKSVDVAGIVQWKPNITGPSDEPRITNGTVFIEKWQPDGSLVPYSPLPSINSHAP